MGINEQFTKNVRKDKQIRIKDKQTDEILVIIKMGNRCPLEFAQLFFSIDNEQVYLENFYDLD